MKKEIELELAGIQKTMLLPLWGRYSESIKEGGLITDTKCISVVESAGIDFADIQKQQHPLTRLAWVTRAWNTDRELIKQLGGKEATVLCLGCGLETAYWRCPHKNLYWVDMDLPEVAKVRERLIGTAEGNTIIAGSVLQAESYSGLQVRGKMIVLAMGLLCYFTLYEVKEVIEQIYRVTPDAIIIMDYFSKMGVDISNRIVLQNCRGTKMQWYAEGEDELFALHPDLEVCETYPLFAKILPLLSGEDAAMAMQSDAQRINSVAILAFGK